MENLASLVSVRRFKMPSQLVHGLTSPWQWRWADRASNALRDGGLLCLTGMCLKPRRPAGASRILQTLQQNLTDLTA